MKSLHFPEVTTEIAKDQPEYLTLPAHVAADGVVTACFRLSLVERVTILLTGRLWWQTMTFGAPLQPQRGCTRKPPEIERGGER